MANLSHSHSLLLVAILITISITAIKCEILIRKEEVAKLGNSSKKPETLSNSSTTSTSRRHPRNNEFKKLYIWAVVTLVTIFVVLFIWFAYELTQDCIKDEEEEQDRSLYLPLYSEEEEEDDINLGDTVYGSNVQSNPENLRSEVSQMESKRDQKETVQK